jgi:hypothetical protein
VSGERGLLELARREAASHPVPLCACGHAWPAHRGNTARTACSICGCVAYLAATLRPNSSTLSNSSMLVAVLALLLSGCAFSIQASGNMGQRPKTRQEAETRVVTDAKWLELLGCDRRALEREILATDENPVEAKRRVSMAFLASPCAAGGAK